MAGLWRQVETPRREYQGYSCDSELNDLARTPQVIAADKLLTVYCNIFLELEENSLQDPSIEGTLHTQVPLAGSSNNVFI